MAEESINNIIRNMNKIHVAKDIFEMTRELDKEMFSVRYSLYYTNTGYNSNELSMLSDMVQRQFGFNTIIVMPLSEPSRAGSDLSDKFKIVHHVEELETSIYKNAVFFNFTLNQLQPRLHLIQRIIINYIDEDNLSLFRFAAIRDRDNLIVPGLTRPKSFDFNINNMVLPYKIIVDSLENNSRIQSYHFSYDKFVAGNILNFTAPFSGFSNVSRLNCNIYKTAMQLAFCNNQALIYLFSNRNFNEFLAKLYCEEIYLNVLFDPRRIVDTNNYCDSSNYPSKPIFMQLNNIPIYPKISDANYIEMQLWSIFLNKNISNMITALPCVESVFKRPFINNIYPCITLDNVDGLVVNYLCTKTTPNVYIF